MSSILIALAGGSGSGKTWLARRLQRRWPGQVTVLRMDDFYRDLRGLPISRRQRVNFDHPDALDWALLETCLQTMQRQQPCRLPRYDFKTHTRHSRWRRWQPRPVVILEGLWSLRSERLRRLYDWSIFVRAPESLRLARRLDRDARERGRSRASILRQFCRQVSPMHRQHVAPQARHADAVVGPVVTGESLAGLQATLKTLLRHERSDS